MVRICVQKSFTKPQIMVDASYLCLLHAGQNIYSVKFQLFSTHSEREFLQRATQTNQVWSFLCNYQRKDEAHRNSHSHDITHRSVCVLITSRSLQLFQESSHTKGNHSNLFIAQAAEKSQDHKAAGTNWCYS